LLLCILNGIRTASVSVLKINTTGTYKILKTDTDAVRIPFRMHNNKPVMNLEINGKKAALMIDNGHLWDEVWLLGSPLVEELSLKPEGDATIGGQGEGDSTQAYTAQNLTLKFRDIEFYEQPVLVSPAAAGFTKMFPGTDGQLCNTFFRHFIVEFDFEQNEIFLHKPDEFKYHGNGSILDMQQEESGSYSVPFAFTMPDKKAYQGRIDLDLGTVYPVNIALGNKYNIQVPQENKPETSYGAQGKNTEFSAKILNMTIGKYQFENPTAILVMKKFHEFILTISGSSVCRYS